MEETIFWMLEQFTPKNQMSTLKNMTQASSLQKPDYGKNILKKEKKDFVVKEKYTLTTFSSSPLNSDHKPDC